RWSGSTATSRRRCVRRRTCTRDRCWWRDDRRMAYTLCEADLARDRDELESLWARNFADQGGHRCDVYTSNPDGPGTVWLLRTAEGKAVGATGLVSRAFGAGQIGQAINLAVDVGHRSAGPALMLQRAVVAAAGERQLPLLGVSVTAEAVQKRAGYRELG